MTRILRTLLALATALAAGCAAYKVVRSGEVNEPLIDRLYVETAALRELPFLRKVGMKVYTKDQLVAYLEEQIEREYAEEEERAVEAALARLGLIGPEDRYFEQVKSLVRESAAGFYDPEAKEFRLIEDFSAGFLLSGAVGAASFIVQRDLVGELVVVHELTHVLQDQHFDLLATLPADLPKTDDDAFLARKTLVETEANVVGYAHLLGVNLADAGERRRLIAALVDQRAAAEDALRDAADGLPEFLVKTLAFQYFGALEFMDRALDQGGWAAEDAVWRSPPRSTEQLLAPEKYFGPSPDEPRAPPPLGLDAPALAGRRSLHANVLGELGLRVLLEERIGAAAAQDAARGWDGDRFDVLEKDGRTALLWRTLWDTEADALAFAVAYGDALEARYGEAARREPTPAPGVDLWRVAAPEGEEFAAVAHRGDAVAIVQGAGASEWDGLLALLFERLQPAENAMRNAGLAGRRRAAGPGGRLPRALTAPPLSLKFML